MSIFNRLLTEKAFPLADGSTSTNLFEMGLQTWDAPESWNIDYSQRIKTLHQGPVDAGSDIILTNSFGGNFHRLKLYRNEERVTELNQASVIVARSVADTAERSIVIAG